MVVEERRENSNHEEAVFYFEGFVVVCVNVVFVVFVVIILNSLISKTTNTNNNTNTHTYLDEYLYYFRSDDVDSPVSGSIHLLMASVKRTLGDFQMAQGSAKVKGKEKDEKVWFWFGLVLVWFGLVLVLVLVW